MENYLDSVKLDYKDIEKQLSKYNYKVIKDRNNRIEYTNFPLFVRSFWCYLMYNNEIPTFENFVDYYLNINKNKRSIKLLNDIDLHFLKGRLSRTYPSLIRDVHFSKLLEKKTDFNVVYNLELDTQKGIDVLVADKYGFHLFYDSKRSNNFRKRKELSYDNNEKIIEFDLPFNAKNGKTVGNIFLYSDYHVIKALELIIKNNLN